ncbi:MAG: recombination-associated protein RdgC [Planctomycetes bacterium]|nr:recombination-associated protein RdgC [Planctomycetota bacterium]
MPAIRRSGGFVAFFWQGKLPDPLDSSFAEALSKHRFRTIENAASEEVSVGWVTAGDPTGDSFATEDLDADPGIWLRMRMDKKTLPKKWLQIHRDVAEKSRGRRLSARERKELRDDLMEKLLPRVLPTVNFIDAVLFAERKTVLLLAGSKTVREAFGKLFFETFTIPLDRGDPYQLGLQCGLDGAAVKVLDRLEPVRWPSDPALAGRSRRSAPTQVEDDEVEEVTS